MEEVRHAIRLCYYSIRTGQAYVDWIRRFIFLHGKRHPREMGEAEVRFFLTHLVAAGGFESLRARQIQGGLSRTPLYLLELKVSIRPPLFDASPAVHGEPCNPRAAPSSARPPLVKAPAVSSKAMWQTRSRDRWR